MVGKARRTASDEPDVAQSARDSAEHIWLAGLGAFSKARQEGGRLFDALVEEGRALEQRTVASAGRRLKTLAEQASSRTEQATARAAATWDKLEQVFEDRVARALGRIGVPTKHDLQSISHRVDGLASRLDQVAPVIRKRASRRVSQGATKRVTGGVARGASRTVTGGTAPGGPGRLGKRAVKRGARAPVAGA